MENQNIRNTLEQNSQLGRFNVVNVPRHVHNNIDSPFAFQPTMIYTGFVGPSIASNLLPGGWKVNHIANGVYSVIHNLGTSQYTVLITIAETALNLGTTVSARLSSNFSIAIRDINDNLSDSPFYFLLANVNNTSVNPPTYITT